MDLRVYDSWSTYIPLVQRIVNSTPHLSIGTSPTRMLFGGLVDIDRQLISTDTSETTSTAEDYVRRLCEAQSSIVEASKKHQQGVIDKYLSSSRDNSVSEFEVGDYVLVSYPDRPPTKLTPRWKGPYCVASRSGSDLYACQDLTTLKLVDYHVSRLKKFVVGEGTDPVRIAQVDKDE